MAQKFSLSGKAWFWQLICIFESAPTSLRTYSMTLNVGSLTNQMHSCGADDLHVQERPLSGLENICTANA